MHWNAAICKIQFNSSSISTENSVVIEIHIKWNNRRIIYWQTIELIIHAVAEQIEKNNFIFVHIQGESKFKCKIEIGNC